MVFLLLLQQTPLLAQQDTTRETQRKKYSLQYWGIAATNNHSAFPFASFSRLFSGPWHPGFEVSTAITWREKNKHQWLQEGKAGYFYQQFIQHGVSLYTNLAYKHRILTSFSAKVGLGAGYFHSMPLQQRFSLQDNGNYEHLKSIGRGQAMIALNLTAGYRFNKTSRHPLEVFITYQQWLQTPYVPSYVPLLPYNSIMLGINWYK